MNASFRLDHIDCWVRGRAFTVDMDVIGAILRLGEHDHKGFIPFKDRMVSVESIQLHIGGYKEGRASTEPLFLRI